jgi:hypothetical protein
MRYIIPRNVKKGQVFLGLDLKGWLFFALAGSLCVGLGWVCYQLSDNLAVSFILGGACTGLFYFLFQVDEQTGTMNGSFFVEIVRWLYSEKVKIFWEVYDYEKFQTLTIRVDLKKRETE